MARDTLRFVAIPGSLRRAAFSRAIAAALVGLAPDDIAVEVLEFVGDLPLYDQDVQDRGMPVRVGEAASVIAAADAVVIVSPEYNHSVPGVLKNALDWLSRLPDPPLARMPVAMQSASPGMLGGVRAQLHLREVLTSMDALVLNKPEVIVTRAAGKVDVEAGAVTDADTRDQMSRQLVALAQVARERRARAD